MGGATAQVSSPAMVLRSWTFSPRSLFSFSSSSSSNKQKKKHQQQQNQHQHQQKPSLHNYHHQERPSLEPCSSSNSSPSPRRREWRDDDEDGGDSGLDTGCDRAQSHSLSAGRTIAKAPTSLSLPLTPRPLVHMPIPRAPPVVPVPPSVTERYRQLLLQRPQSHSLSQQQQQSQQQQRKKEKPEKDRFRFRRWHPKKRKRNKSGFTIMGYRSHQQQEGDYHRLAHHLGQGDYKSQTGIEVRVPDRGGSLSHSCTDTSSCSNSALNQGSDGGRFGAGSSSIDDGGSSSNDCHYNNTNRANLYNNSGCDSNSINGRHKHYNSSATNHYNSSGCASSIGYPAVDIDQQQYNNLHKNNGRCTCASSSPPFGRIGYSDGNGEVFSSTVSIKAFNFNQTRHYAATNVDVDKATNNLTESNIFPAKHKNYVSELLEDLNPCYPYCSSFGLTPDNRILKAYPTDSSLTPKDNNVQSSDYLGFHEEKVCSASPSYLARPAISSSSSSNIPCSFLESFVNSPITSSKNGFIFENDTGSSKKYPGSLTINDSCNRKNSNYDIEVNDGTKTDKVCTSFDGRQTSNEIIEDCERGHSECDASSGDLCASKMNIKSTSARNTENSTSSIDEFLGASKLDLLTPPGPSGLSALDVYLASRDRRVMVRVSALLWLMKLDQDRAARARLRYQEEQRRKAWMRRLAGSSSGDSLLGREAGGPHLFTNGAEKPTISPGDYDPKGDQADSGFVKDQKETVEFNELGSKKRMVCDELRIRGQGRCGIGMKKGSSSRELEITSGVQDTNSKRRVWKESGIKGRVGYEWRNAVLRRGRKQPSVTSSSGTNTSSQRVTTNSFYRQSYRSDNNDDSVGIDDDKGDDEDDGYGTSHGMFRRRVNSDNDYRSRTNSAISPSVTVRDSQNCKEEMARSVDLTPSLSHRYFVGVVSRYGDDHCFHRNPTYGWRRQSPNYPAMNGGGSALSFTYGHPLQVSTFSFFLRFIV